MKITPKTLYDLFVHRKDAFAIQGKNGSYFTIRREITLTDIEKHLKGAHTIGVYCLNTDNTVKWACVDLDGTDLRRLNKESDIIFQLFSEFARMKEFSGRRGFHVWIFFDKPTPALLAQKLVKARLNRVGLNKHECFPKQVELNENRKFGNLVKLPCGIHRKSGKRSEILKMEGLE